MLELVKSKKDNGTTDLTIKTNQGDFIVYKNENGALYVGYFEDSEEQKAPVQFIINQENYIIYKMFRELYNDLSYGDEKVENVEILSTDDKQEEAIFLNISSDDNTADVEMLSTDEILDEPSTLNIELDKNNSDIVLTLTKSTSKKWKDTYWVEIPADKSIAFERLYNDLFAYDNNTNQISIVDYVDLMIKDPVRSRSILGGKR